MALTILIKFCGLIVHPKPNNMVHSAFPGNVPESGKIFPEPTDQSRLNSIYMVLSQILLVHIFVFDLPLKLRVVHIRKKF